MRLTELTRLSAPRIGLLLTTCLLGGCLSLDDRPDPPVFAPDAAFSRDLPPLPMDAVASDPWWRIAVAEQYALPMEQALAGNASLRGAQAGVDAARARLDQARAASGPAATLGADAGVQKVSSSDRTSSRSIGVAADLPIDVSGALAYREAAALQTLRAVTADMRQLASDLARDYLLALVDAAEADRRSALLGRQLEVAQTLLRLIELRFTQGLASSVDVLQQRDELAALRQQVPLAQLDRVQATNRLRRVANLTPDRPLPLTIEYLPTVQAGFAAATPLDLLQRRPGLRAERARLAAADARFAAALADRLPTVSLSGAVLTRTVSGDASTLVSAVLDAAFTLFDSGSREAIAAERRAELYAAGQTYLTRWIELVAGVDDLINEEASLREQIDLSRTRLDTAQALLEAAQRRYERGVSDYLPVLAALRGLQQQQRDHLALRAALARTRVRLHHALDNPPAEDEA